MATLTVLDEKLAEVLGLAQAAQAATAKAARLARDEDETKLQVMLERMGEEAATTEERCQQVADTRDGKKTAIAEKAQETKNEVTGFMSTYLEDADALDGLEFLSMAEAGELAHWEILAKLNERALDSDIEQLTKAALLVQRKHVDQVRDAALELAADEDPSEES